VIAAPVVLLQLRDLRASNQSGETQVPAEGGES
jgi:hypothetical protein